MFVFLILSSAVAYVLLKWIDFRRIYVSLRLPGPFPLPLVGNGLYFVNKTTAEAFKMVDDLHDLYGSTYRMWAGTTLSVILTDPKDVEVVLTNPKYMEKHTDYAFLKPWLNEGLLTSKGIKWMKRRKIITPAFHFSILEENVPCFDRHSEVLAKKMKNYKPTDNVEFLPMITTCALDSLCESAMGISLNSQLTESEYARSLKQFIHILTVRGYAYLLRSELFFQLSTYGKLQKRLLRTLLNFTNDVIMKRREKLINTSVENNNENVDEYGIKRKKAFLDILLQSKIDGEPLSNTDIREEVDTFMFEGHDTTTSGILFALYNIAKYPEVQDKCFKEIQQVLGNDKTAPISLTELNQMHYLELVIKESLRLFPPVPIIGRFSREETTINGKTIPANCNLWINIFHMGRNGKTFPNPEQFIPERFDVETTTDVLNPYAYIPFSAGQRNCIGQKFAVLEMKSMISKILRYYEISLTEKTKNEELVLSWEVILTSIKPIYFHIKSRL